MIKVLIVDDHTLIREGITKILSLDSEINVIEALGSGEEALNYIEENEPHIVLLDLNLPGINGVDTCKKIKELKPEIDIIILTIYEEESYVFEAIKAGGSGYLLKDVGPDILIQAIKDVREGKSLLHPRVTTKVFKEFNRLDTLANKATKSRLTDREIEVLQLVAEGNSNKEVAAQLFISEKTVKNHISNLFQKLEVTDRTGAVVKAMKNNLI